MLKSVRFTCSAVCCLGTMTWGKQNTEAEAHEQLSYAFDYGLNFMDTAGEALRSVQQGICNVH